MHKLYLKIKVVLQRFWSFKGKSLNPFLKELFDIIAIDIEHLNGYLTHDEFNHLNGTLKSIADLDGEFYTNERGSNLEVLLFFLYHNLEDIKVIWEDPRKKEVLLALYMSNTVSGNYDCFHFDLSKFKQTYNPIGQKITLYRLGRSNETMENLGNSWSQSTSGIKNYAQASSINIDSRPVFAIDVNDSEVLCLGNSTENELILKKDFEYIEVKLLSNEERNGIFLIE